MVLVQFNFNFLTKLIYKLFSKFKSLEFYTKYILFYIIFYNILELINN